MSSKERLKFYKKEWLKKSTMHIFLQVCLWFAIVSGARLIFGLHGGLLGGVSGLTAVVLYARLSNEMMKYAEDRAFDGSGD